MVASARLVVRALRLLRDLRRVGPVAEACRAAIEARTAEATAALARLEAGQRRLQDARDRLRGDVASLEVLRAELERAQEDLTGLRGSGG